ncbi:glycoprotein endo-alpha-1,2-mannosidase-like protein [Rhagoletis pomonella]|uniref:glycoprotein endo-alpha-1,2-mannosidase-like protein n=1 Tax=Rhagoletis pomonella TaxID=28610 RepID=UPI00177C12F6|nr:glycoprotein endo-alpha-1,2-mannosidase-like protein [Rhagoletis pomonella]
MLLKKYLKNRRKLKILFLLMVIVLIVVTVVVLNISPNVGSTERVLDEHFIARIYGGSGVGIGGGGAGAGSGRLEQPPLKSPRQNGIIVPEKYDEHKVKARIAQQRLQQLKQEQQQQRNAIEPGEEHTTLDAVTTGVHIFYSAPVAWYKTKKSQQPPVVPQLQLRGAAKELLNDVSDAVQPLPTSTAATATVKPVRILNTAFYPALGLYKPTTNLLQKHFDNIRNCGIGVLILSCSGKAGEVELYQQLLDLAPAYNLSITFEISVAGNQSVEFLQQQLEAVRRYSTAESFYRVYSLSRKRLVPLIYVSNAYKLSETPAGRALCQTHPESLRRIFDAYFIGHIRLKNHVDIMRRLCFEGFYSKLPSNGATFASTWKNWSYLKSFAMTYKMLFVPTVGPGFAERNKFPRHGDIQRHRSNGRYYGVAWRTAILNHVGFINIASYNNWPDGSQIEEVIPKAGFLDYNPGAKTKYIDLTTHWVGNFLKTRNEAAAVAVPGQPSCYEFLNNTIC